MARDSQTLGLDREEAVRFLGAAQATSARDHALACLLTLNGLRVSEACAADVVDLGVERGYGRWVRDVLVWTKKPLLFRNELVAVDGLAGEARAAEPGEVKRVGSDPVILPLAANGGARVEIATASDDRGRALGPLAAPAPPPAKPG